METRRRDVAQAETQKSDSKDNLVCPPADFTKRGWVGAASAIAILNLDVALLHSWQPRIVIARLSSRGGEPHLCARS
ncbi:hypothetical protein B296_00042286 [Ensete ventricosum]|uniref:Uncharacterized protein n=1 Tax=Ensete ventricosum TaxID=4639 RepID=A0A426YGN5_ENSVE|nr:hypothetical protein B296_00042286 [Ensete ventricosum]